MQNSFLNTRPMMAGIQSSPIFGNGTGIGMGNPQEQVTCKYTTPERDGRMCWTWFVSCTDASLYSVTNCGGNMYIDKLI